MASESEGVGEMKRSGAIRGAGVTLALAAASGLAACGGSMHHTASTHSQQQQQVQQNSQNPTTSATTTPTQTSLSIGNAANFAGGQIIGEGSGEQISVTVQRVVNPITHGVTELGTAAPPAPAGQHYIAVELSIDSTGTSAYSDSPGMEMSLISKNTGGAVGQAMPSTTGPGQCATDLSTSVNIAPGQTERGCVFFQVPNDQPINSVQYQTQGGQGGNLATWSAR